MTGEYYKKKRNKYQLKGISIKRIICNRLYLLIHNAGVIIDTRRQILAQTEVILCGCLAINGILKVHGVDAPLAAVSIANEQELFQLQKKTH